MAVIGDIMSHSTNFKNAYSSVSKDYDFSNVFKNIKSKISDADIAIGNLETTFAGPQRGYSGYPTFSTPDALAYNLKDLGIDLLSTANNHCMDKGYTGLTRTLDILDKVKIEHAGTSRSEEDQNTVVIKDVNGIKIAFLSYTYGTNGITVPSDKKYAVNMIDKELIKKHLDAAKEKNPDLICVNMHWGIEYQLKENKEQDNLADFLFENGVDCIFGSHPHVLQPMEKRTITLEDGTTKDGFVIYSLGNFMSGQIYAHTKSTVILDIQVTKNSEDKISIDSINYTPVYLYDKGAGAKARTRYTLYDLEKSISDYEKGNSNITKSMYNTFKSELKSIKSIVGKPITE
jgi:poly-gamma-glutamate synthesis protein (capsule biosynthesis protein)